MRPAATLGDAGVTNLAGQLGLPSVCVAQSYTLGFSTNFVVGA